MSKNNIITVIPDMHGENNWKRAIDIKSDYYISLGDWFDSFTIPYHIQKQNFKEFANWANTNPEHIIMTLGNHDYSYLQPSHDIENNYNAFSSGYCENEHEAIQRLLFENIHLIKPAVQLNNIVFSHAGISKTWLQRNNVTSSMQLFGDNWYNYDLDVFKFQELNNDDIEKHIMLDDYGDNIFQGPLWIRPESLLKDSNYPYQIVGHTEMCYNNNPAFLKRKNKHIIVCDSENHDIIFTFNTKDITTFPYTSIANYQK